MVAPFVFIVGEVVLVVKQRRVVPLAQWRNRASKLSARIVRTMRTQFRPAWRLLAAAAAARAAACSRIAFGCWLSFTASSRMIRRRWAESWSRRRRGSPRVEQLFEAVQALLAAAQSQALADAPEQNGLAAALAKPQFATQQQEHAIRPRVGEFPVLVAGPQEFLREMTQERGLPTPAGAETMRALSGR